MKASNIFYYLKYSQADNLPIVIQGFINMFLYFILFLFTNLNNNSHIKTYSLNF